MRERVRIVAMAGAFLLAGCSAEGPQAQVAKAFEACLEGVRQGDARTVSERLSPRFEGPEGMDKGTVSFYLAGLFRKEKVGVTVISQRIELLGPEAASQMVDVVLTGKAGTSLLPDESGRKGFLLRWERREGKWLLRELREVTP